MMNDYTSYPPPASPPTSPFPPKMGSYPATSVELLTHAPKPHNESHHGMMEETEEELTEDEWAQYEQGVLSWEKAKNWKFGIRKEWWWWYLIFVVLIVLVALMAFFHRQVSCRILFLHIDLDGRRTSKR